MSEDVPDQSWLDAGLRLLNAAVASHNSVQVDHVATYLRDEARKHGPDEVTERLEREIASAKATAQTGRAVRGVVRLPSSRKASPKRTQRRESFVCRFCHSRWDGGMETPKGPVCVACYYSVMCPRCFNRRPDGFDTCFKCNPNSGLGKGARPNPFRN